MTTQNGSTQMLDEIQNALLNAVRDDNIEDARKAFTEGATTNFLYGNDRRSLLSFVRSPAMVDLLVEKGQVLYPRDVNGDLPDLTSLPQDALKHINMLRQRSKTDALLKAIEAVDLIAVEFLLQDKDLNIDNLPLTGNESVDNLIKTRRDNVATPQQRLFWAIIDNDTNGAITAIQSGADINYVYNNAPDGGTVAHYVRSPEMVQLLRQKQCRFDIPDNNGRRAFEKAFESLSALAQNPEEGSLSLNHETVEKLRVHSLDQALVNVNRAAQDNDLVRMDEEITRARQLGATEYDFVHHHWWVADGKTLTPEARDRILSLVSRDQQYIIMGRLPVDGVNGYELAPGSGGSPKVGSPNIDNELFVDFNEPNTQPVAKPVEKKITPKPSGDSGVQADSLSSSGSKVSNLGRGLSFAATGDAIAGAYRSIQEGDYSTAALYFADASANGAEMEETVFALFKKLKPQQAEKFLQSLSNHPRALAALKSCQASILKVAPFLSVALDVALRKGDFVSENGEPGAKTSQLVGSTAVIGAGAAATALGAPVAPVLVGGCLAGDIVNSVVDTAHDDQRFSASHETKQHLKHYLVRASLLPEFQPYLTITGDVDWANPNAVRLLQNMIQSDIDSNTVSASSRFVPAAEAAKNVVGTVADSLLPGAGLWRKLFNGNSSESSHQNVESFTIARSQLTIAKSALKELNGMQEELESGVFPQGLTNLRDKAERKMAKSGLFLTENGVLSRDAQGNYQINQAVCNPNGGPLGESERKIISDICKRYNLRPEIVFSALESISSSKVAEAPDSQKDQNQKDFRGNIDSEQFEKYVHKIQGPINGESSSEQKTAQETKLPDQNENYRGIKGLNGLVHYAQPYLNIDSDKKTKFLQPFDLGISADSVEYVQLSNNKLGNLSPTTLSFIASGPGAQKGKA